MVASMEHLAELGVVAGVCERLFGSNYAGPHILYEALVHGLHSPVSLHTSLADLAVDIFRFAVLQHFGDRWSNDHHFERRNPALPIGSRQQFLGNYSSERYGQAKPEH